MSSRASFFTFLSMAIIFIVPLAAHAGGIPFFGPIVPKSGDIVGFPNSAVCAAGFGMLMIVINNIISFLLTLAIVFVAPLMIAWAGFLFVVNPVNPAGKEQAKKILTNTIVGIVIALAGWLIVDAIMAVLYEAPSGSNWGTTWNSLVTGGGDVCLPQKGL